MVSGTTRVWTTSCSRARQRQRTRMEGCTGASDSGACSTTTIVMRPDRCSIGFGNRTGVASAKPRVPPLALRHGENAHRERIGGNVVAVGAVEIKERYGAAGASVEH